VDYRELNKVTETTRWPLPRILDILDRFQGSVHSKTFEEHINHLDIVLDKLRAANLKVNHEKCSWCTKTV